MPISKSIRMHFVGGPSIGIIYVRGPISSRNISSRNNLKYQLVRTCMKLNLRQEQLALVTMTVRRLGFLVDFSLGKGTKRALNGRGTDSSTTGLYPIPDPTPHDNLPHLARARRKLAE